MSLCLIVGYSLLDKCCIFVINSSSNEKANKKKEERAEYYPNYTAPLN
ncbi:hypothetical protein SAMN05444280_10592 [Tangfeifania diversioriginum]|uniref:Uncharacterized protein n=1 Tax=Tangfeifania diversioriginum TaxID=1168035 RepID=A0A1M6DK61_9BACT|nr:hypothetical protein SAMN05444280_10592 [Tangfeifania diversioriginum]